MSRCAPLLSLFVLATLRAQELRPSISGVIGDPTGAPVRSARIEASGVSTGTVASAETNEAGYYGLLFLPPDRYIVTIEAPGFKRYVHEGIELETAERRGLDVRLEIGPLTETVTVSGNANALETENASRGPTIVRRQIVDIPNNGRNIYQLVWAAPGVTKASTYWGSMEPYATGNATAVQINGGVIRENESVLDGVTDTQPTRDVAFQPPLEAVEEARVLTSTYDAAYGRFGGGVVALTTKSGSNEFHGAAYETNKVAALAANSWLLNSLGQSNPHFVNNTFGFQTGGPLSLPKVFNSRNRLLFMLAYEGLRERSSGSASTIVPTAAQRAGDFSALPRVLYDPLTTRQEGTRFVRTAFDQNRIPAERLDPVAQNVLKFIPLPNLPGRAYPFNNYANFGSAQNGYDEFLSKLDVRIDARNKLYFSYGRLPFEQFGATLFGHDSPAEPSSSNPLYRNFYRWVADWSSTLGPRTVLDLRAGLARYVNTRGNPAALGFDPRTLGFSSALVSQFGFLQFPAFNLGGGYTAIGTAQPFVRNANDSWSYQLNLSHIVSRHQLRAGAEFRIYNQNSRTPGRASGQYNFTKGFTQADPARADAASGDELASFLLGYPSSGAADLNIDPAFQSRYYALFLEDDWKVSSRLNLNLGLRWDYERPYAERYNRMERGFAFGQPSPIAAQVGQAIAGQAILPAVVLTPLTGGVLFAGSSGEDRLAYQPDRNNFQPRIGVVYQAARNWVVRGGYGLYYLGVSSTQPTSGFSQATSMTASLDGGNTPRVTLANAFPEGLVQPTGSRLGMATQLGQAVSFGYLNRVIPYSQQFSAGFEGLLPGGFVVEAGYSGNQTRRYPVTAQLNAIPASELGHSDSYYLQRVPNPLAGLLPANAAKNGPSIPLQDLLLPFPQYTTVTMTDIPIGRNSYHSLQTRLTRRYSAGVAVSVAYTFSKTLEQLSFLNAQDFNLANIEASRLEKRLAQFDAPQKLAVLASYELPGARSRHRALSGWQINADLTLQSGFPVDFPNAANLQPRSAKLPASQVNLYHAFDTSLFPGSAPNLQYSLRTFPTRFPDVRLYPLRNLDISIAKKTRLTERARLEIRAEFLNAANHPWFSRINDRGTDVTSPQFGWYQLEEQNQNRLVALVGKLSF